MLRQLEKSLDIELRRLNEVSKSDIIELMRHPLVRRHMPLSSDSFGELDCDEFIANKERLWAEHGYGPWAFIVDGQFAGWGGLQPEEGDADLALVLHPRHWGIGKTLYDQIMERAFGDMGFQSVTILFPRTRTRIKGMLRLGFQPDGEVEIGGERFHRYRLHAAG
jgi:RimJ/RimL family protein N-acetyltransferase